MGLTVWPTAGWSLRLGWSPWGRSACTFRCLTGLQKLKLEIPDVPGSFPNLLQFRRFFVVFSRTFSEINYASAMMSKKTWKLQVKFLVVSCVPCGEQAVKLQVPKNQSICDPFQRCTGERTHILDAFVQTTTSLALGCIFWFAWPNNPEQTSTNIYHVPPVPYLAGLLPGLGSKHVPRQEHRIFMVPERQLDTFNSEANNWVLWSYGALVV